MVLVVSYFYQYPSGFGAEKGEGILRLVNSTMDVGRGAWSSSGDAATNTIVWRYAVVIFIRVKGGSKLILPSNPVGGVGEIII